MLTAFARQAGEERLRDFQRLARERGYSRDIELYEPGGTTRMTPMVREDGPCSRREHAGCRPVPNLTPKERSQILAACGVNYNLPPHERYMLSLIHI